jgi:hypothetical protein
MWNKAALLAAVLVLALPAFADNPSNLTRKSSHTQAPKSGVPISPKKPQGPRAAGKLEETEFEFNKTTQTNVIGGKGSSPWNAVSSGTKKPTKPKRRPRALQLNNATIALPPPK